MSKKTIKTVALKFIGDEAAKHSLYIRTYKEGDKTLRLSSGQEVHFEVPNQIELEPVSLRVVAVHRTENLVKCGPESVWTPILVVELDVTTEGFDYTPKRPFWFE